MLQNWILLAYNSSVHEIALEICYEYDFNLFSLVKASKGKLKWTCRRFYSDISKMVSKIKSVVVLQEVTMGCLYTNYFRQMVSFSFCCLLITLWISRTVFNWPIMLQNKPFKYQWGLLTLKLQSSFKSKYMSQH